MASQQHHPAASRILSIIPAITFTSVVIVSLITILSGSSSLYDAFRGAKDGSEEIPTLLNLLDFDGNATRERHALSPWGTALHIAPCTYIHFR